MRRALDQIEIPGEHEARDRSWHIAEAAFSERQPAPRRSRRKLVPAVVIVATGVVAAAALSSPGKALLHSIRQTVGVQGAKPALFWVVTPGTLLVHSDSGTWVVQRDGANRRLGAYASASWSPHGLYVAATRRNELVALTPSGTVRWSLARPRIRGPVWTGTRTNTRIAYTSADELRVVGGDGRGDTGLGSAPDLGGAPLAWRPGTSQHVLAYALPRQQILRVVDVDAKGEEIWSATLPGHVSRLEWSADGRFLLAFAPIGLRVFNARGKVVERDDPSDPTRDTDATFVGGTDKVAVVRQHGARSGVFLLDSGRSLFHVVGRLGQVVASPDGRSLIVAWPDADQWVFIQLRSGRVSAVSNVSARFRSQTFPRIAGWCCAP